MWAPARHAFVRQLDAGGQGVESHGAEAADEVTGAGEQLINRTIAHCTRPRSATWRDSTHGRCSSRSRHDAVKPVSSGVGAHPVGEVRVHEHGVDGVPAGACHSG